MKRNDINKWITVNKLAAESTKRLQQRTPPKHYSCLVSRPAVRFFESRLRGDDEVRHLPIWVIKLSASIPIVLLLFSTLILLAIPIPTNAQWIEGGIQLNRYRINKTIQILATDDGGFWIVYEDPFGDMHPKTWVQHFDSDGYAQFPEQGIPVVPDSTLRTESTDLFGAVLRPDGNILVAFCANMNETYGYSIYAQVINREGEYLFGPTGATVFEARGIQWVPFGNWPLVAPDGEGGLWVYFENPNARNDMLIAGINGDGTAKLDHQLALGEHDGDPYPIIGPDGVGGCYVIETIRLGMQNYQYFAHHVNAEGELEPEDPYLIYHGPRSVGNNYHIVTDDQSNTMYLCNLEESLYQRVDPGGILPWGLEGRTALFAGGDASPAAISADGGVLSIGYRRAQINDWEVFRLRSDGTPFYDAAVQQIDSISFHSDQERCLLIPTLDRTSFTVVSGNTYYFGVDFSKIGAFQFGETPVNEWDENGILVDYRNADEEGFYVFRSLQAGTRLADGGCVFVIDFNNSNYQLQNTYLYKINADGTVAGRETSIGDEPQHFQPKGFRLRSAFPNPFNGTVTLRVDLAYPGDYEWTVYSLTGQEVARKSLTTHHAGLFEQTWTPRESLAGGVYLVRWTKAGQHLTTKKLVYLP